MNAAAETYVLAFEKRGVSLRSIFRAVQARTLKRMPVLPGEQAELATIADIQAAIAARTAPSRALLRQYIQAAGKVFPKIRPKEPFRKRLEEYGPSAVAAEKALLAGVSPEELARFQEAGQRGFEIGTVVGFRRAQRVIEAMPEARKKALGLE